MPLGVAPDPTPMIKLLGGLSERMKAQFLVACLRHAWDEHVRYAAGARLPEETLAWIDDLLEARPDALIDLSLRLRTRIEALQALFDGARVAAKAGAPGALAAATVAYAIGKLLGWFYHAFGALSGDPALTWAGYATRTRKFLPFWLVLDGAASVGGLAERAWQAQVMAGFAAEEPLDAHARPASDARWCERTFQLGLTFRSLWLAPWDEKRALIEQAPELTEPARRDFTVLAVMRNLTTVPAESREAFAALIHANELLLHWCDAALCDAKAEGRDARAALAAVFANDDLRREIEERSAEPAAP